MKNHTIILFILFIQNLANGQTFTTVSDTVYLTISSDIENVEIYEILPLVISNTTNVALSGHFTSEVEIIISPIPETTIQIIPTPPTFTPETGTDSGCCTTVIRTSTGGPGKIKPNLDTVPSIKLYPNPVHETLTFNTSNIQAVGYVIYDLNGKEQISSKIKPTNEYSINVSLLKSGNYILNIVLQDHRVVQMHFIKK